MKGGTFEFFVSGRRDNDRLVLKYLETEKQNCPYLFFKLPYDPPYQPFKSIRKFQYETRYRPFMDGLSRQKLCILDVSEWVEHSDEEYLEIFLKFLHDYQGFFEFEYLFMVSDFSKEDIRPLFLLVSRYLKDGRIYEDHTLSDWHTLQSILVNRYPVSEDVAGEISRILVTSQIEGLAQAETIMEDFCGRFRDCFTAAPVGKVLSEKDILREPEKMRDSIFYLFYQERAEQWYSRLIADSEREQAGSKSGRQERSDAA